MADTPSQQPGRPRIQVPPIPHRAHLKQHSHKRDSAPPLMQPAVGAVLGGHSLSRCMMLREG